MWTPRRSRRPCRSTSTACRLRAFTLEGRARRGRRADPGAHQHGDARLFQRRWASRCAAGPDFADLQRRDGAAAGDRQRGVRPPLPRGRRGDRPDALETRGSTFMIAGVVRQLAERVVRREADAGHLPVVSRSARRRAARFTCARAPAPNRCSRRRWSASCASWIRRCRSTTSARCPSTSRRTCSSAASRRGCSWCSGPLLLVLAAIGIYAVVAYTVSLRTTEIGVRLALGATAGRVVSQIVVERCASSASARSSAGPSRFVVDLHLLRGPIYLSVFARRARRPPARRVRGLLAAGAARGQRRSHGGAATGMRILKFEV